MNHFTISCAANRAKSTFPLKQNCFSALQGHFSRNGQADDPGTDDDTVDLIHLSAQALNDCYFHPEIVTFSVF
jgi:hypothetical protein